MENYYYLSPIQQIPALHTLSAHCPHCEYLIRWEVHLIHLRVKETFLNVPHCDRAGVFSRLGHHQLVAPETHLKVPHCDSP
jgi:hypothetical protein